MNDHSVRASMLIRKPPLVVFDAFANPATITRFWLAATTGPLAPGATVTWQFMVPGATDAVTVQRFEPGRHLAFRWGGGIEVAMEFELYEAEATRISVICAGFDERELLAQATGTIEGFAIVLCDLKTLLETGRSANLVRDKAELIAMAKR
jgi:uncharacterized protein YndB with AHSA1/START domain